MDNCDNSAGNAAAMREALEHVEKLAREFAAGNYYVSGFPKMLLDAIRPALAAPPRACDIMPEENLIKVVSSGIMQSITSRPEFNFEELKALVEAVAASAIKCAYDTQLISKGATDGGK